MLVIDPGLKPGFAVFDETSKEMCECTNDKMHVEGYYSWIVCERPMVYPFSKADPNTLISLALTAGRLIEWFSPPQNGKLTLVPPREWKGNIPKTKALKDYIVYQRVVKTLNSFENKELARAIKGVGVAAFDIVDAVGIGLYVLERL